jgi:enediyne biosynthesis protein E4
LSSRVSQAASWKQGAAFFILVATIAGCGLSPPLPAPAESWFVDRAADAGLRFTHANGMSGKFDYPEIIGSGTALFDMDNDGDLDVFLVQYQGQSRLFRNNLHDGALSFTDVTRTSGIVTRGGGMGVAAGDFDNDGCVDLYLTNLGPNQLFHNNCDGTFTDVSARSGVAGQAGDWSVSAAFLDYDRDGWLDLFVGHYLNWNAASAAPCFGPSGRPDYCSPNTYPPQRSHLYHNNRDGTFTDVTAAAGLAADFGPALGVTTADFDGDGWIDLYVANDGQPNQLWVNQRNGTFRNFGLLSGTALSAHGKAKAGMGVDAGDIDNDGHEDLFVTNLTGEGNDLYVNNGAGLFEEQSAQSGLGPASRAYTGFGAAWFDIDNDGRLDLAVVNGAVQTIEALRRVNDPFPLHQRKLLFRNLGPSTGSAPGTRFEDVTAQGGAAFQLSEVGRGAAFGDVDNDGATDVLVANNNGPPRLLINKAGARNHWVGLRLIGGKAPRDMLGARVEILLDNGTTLWRRARSDGSYASANDPRVLAGLGSSARPPRVHVAWPDGSMEEWSSVPVDRYTTLTQGSGK